MPGPAVTLGKTSTTVLGAWYATVLRWRRPAALLVNELTLLPLVMPLTPARTRLTRFPDALAELLSAHRVPAQLIEAERVQALDHRLAATANRSLVGVMNEFAYLADLDRAENLDLMRLSMRLATTPCRNSRLSSPDFNRLDNPARNLTRPEVPQGIPCETLAAGCSGLLERRRSGFGFRTGLRVAHASIMKRVTHGGPLWGGPPAPLDEGLGKPEQAGHKTDGPDDDADRRGLVRGDCAGQHVGKGKRQQNPEHAVAQTRAGRITDPPSGHAAL